MKKYGWEFKHKAVTKAFKNGIKPTARELKISKNTLKRWIKIYKEKKLKNEEFKIEKMIVFLKEKEPHITLKEIQKNLKNKKILISLKKIYFVLKKYGISNKSLLPFQGEKSNENVEKIERVKYLIEKDDFKNAAKILNSLPSLYDFSILKNFPQRYLSLRRKVEQLIAIWGNLSMKEMYKRAKKLRTKCEKRKMLISAMLAATMEMNALNFLGKIEKIYFLYKKYKRYLKGIPLCLKYAFLNECFIAFYKKPEKYPLNIFENFLSNFEKFCLKLEKQENENKIQWFYLLSGWFSLKEDIKKSLKWIEKIIFDEKIDIQHKKIYFSQYFPLLILKGEYKKVIKEIDKDFLKETPLPGLLRISLSLANAFLGIGKVEKCLKIAFDGFLKAKKEHIASMISGFLFLISCCYSALKEKKKSKRYLRMALYFSKNLERTKIFYNSLLKFSPIQNQKISFRFKLLNLYISFGKTLKYKDYIKVHKFAEKKGLIGILHHIILLHPEPIINLLKKGKNPFLSPEFLNLPIFNEIPVFKVFLLRKKEFITYGNKKIKISDSKDFHLIIYLFLNRKRFIEKEEIYKIFFKNSKNPYKSLIKSLSRIRKILGISKNNLFLKKEGVFFDMDAKIDLEEFKNRYKMGKVLEKIGEINKALKEYKEAINLYKKPPFEKIGYYYNFAEDERNIIINMYKEMKETISNYACLS
jgi:transposase-like protein/DNA-binding winged helix-turn-helix (wHTH) protein